MKPNSFFGHDILTAGQFSKDDVELVIQKAKEMREIVTSKGSTDILHGKIMTALFYEPSSRTFGSFIAAMQRLGGGFIPLQGMVYSSVAKGESLEDTIQTFASYSDIVVMRHPQVGSVKIAADACQKPVINAGDGVGEHPTQALLDLFTIADHFGSLENLTITLVGDLINGRAFHSLVTLLSLYKPKAINFVSPVELKMPTQYVELIKKLGIKVQETESLDAHLSSSDVIYITRVQKERFRDLDLYERLKHRFIITKETMDQCKKTAILMHPFPRVAEVTTDVDSDPRAVYIRSQMPNGMYVRMALLSLVLKEA